MSFSINGTLFCVQFCCWLLHATAVWSWLMFENVLAADFLFLYKQCILLLIALCLPLPAFLLFMVVKNTSGQSSVAVYLK